MTRLIKAIALGHRVKHLIDAICAESADAARLSNEISVRRLDMLNGFNYLYRDFGIPCSFYLGDRDLTLPTEWFTQVIAASVETRQVAAAHAWKEEFLRAGEDGLQTGVRSRAYYQAQSIGLSLTALASFYPWFPRIRQKVWVNTANSIVCEIDDRVELPQYDVGLWGRWMQRYLRLWVWCSFLWGTADHDGVLRFGIGRNDRSAAAQSRAN